MFPYRGWRDGEANGHGGGVTLYTNLTATAARLLGKYKTGTVEIGTTSTTAGANPWDAPTVTDTWEEVDAVVTGVPAYMVDGGAIVASDRMVIMQGDVDVGDKMRIDGAVVLIVRKMPKLAAGDPVITKVVVR
jgi:hypothetical protein